jgi:hypothetical protein
MVWKSFVEAMAKGSGKPADKMAAGIVREYRPTSLLQRFARVEEIANMVGLRGLEGSVSHQWRCAQGRGQNCSDNRLTHHGDDSNVERKAAITAERGRQVPGSLGVDFGHDCEFDKPAVAAFDRGALSPPIRRALMCRR